MTSRILCGATAVFSVTTGLLGTQAANSSDRLMKNASVIPLCLFPRRRHVFSNRLTEGVHRARGQKVISAGRADK
jgi:hypothetical protein